MDVPLTVTSLPNVFAAKPLQGGISKQTNSASKLHIKGGAVNCGNLFPGIILPCKEMNHEGSIRLVFTQNHGIVIQIK